ncbi:MAG: spermidine/putrescine ABC transporter substrate-binding protein [Verrucomicrobiales bacterium]|nr:spermidine/putrescine ABC transporter substrate-binding protein [Verrucomicrobiales bacterium]
MNVISRAIRKGVYGTLLAISLSSVSCRQPNATDKHASPPAAATQLSILTWSEYLVPEVIERFEKEAGVTVKVTEVENSDRLIQTLGEKAGAFDIVIADNDSVRRLADLSLLATLDHSKLTHFGQLDPQFVDLWFDPRNRYSVPYLWGATGFAYHKGRLPGGVDSWDSLWDPKLRGRLAVLDEPIDLQYIALLSEGKSPETALEADFDEAGLKLVEIFSDVEGRMTDCITAIDLLQSGRMDVVMTYGGDAAQRMESDPNIAFVLPKEGSLLWLDSFVISRDSSAPDLAHQFIDYMTRPEIAGISSNRLRFATPNLAARDLLDPDLANDPNLYPQVGCPEKHRFLIFPPENRRFADRQVIRLFERLREKGLSIDVEQVASHQPEGTSNL